MSDLYPTKTRLALLRAVAAGEVDYYPAWRSDKSQTRWGGRRVTASIEELARAGWVRTGKANHPSMYAVRPIELTDAGRAVLDAHGGES